MKTEQFEEYEAPKKSWDAGPWQTEPDRASWVDVETGLFCLIVRNRVGSLCGYVGVAKGHKYHGNNYDDVNVDVHGGLTYSNSNGTRIGVDGGDDIWWLGFDTAHIGDYCPAYAGILKGVRKSLMERNETYKDFDYVKTECEKLAKQLK